MTVTVAQFRQDFPEFKNKVTYPDAQVTFWSTFADRLLSATRWGNMRDMAQELYIAHNISLEALAQKEAANGGIPGGSVGPVNNKSVDKVSVGYDIQSSTEPDAGHWNLSIYGTRLKRLINMFGAGPIQIGAGPGCGFGGWAGFWNASFIGAADAWSGPWQPQFPNMNG